MLLDHFILTFKSNNDPIIVADGKPAKWLSDQTFEEAEVLKQENGLIEIAIPVGTFLKIKDNDLFQQRCRNLVRLRTTPMTTLCYLCHPINQIDNRL